MGPLVGTPTHRTEHTGDPIIDRIQGTVRDLVHYVRGLGWLKQRAYVALDTDKTITTALYADLLSVTITSTERSGFLSIEFTASGLKLAAAGTVFFRVLVDNIVIKGAYTTVTATWSFPVAIIVRAPVVAGLHTVSVQWKTNTNSAQILAKTVVEEHAALSIQEVAA